MQVKDSMKIINLWYYELTFHFPGFIVINPYIWSTDIENMAMGKQIVPAYKTCNEG